MTPLLRKNNKNKRIAWVKKHEEWTVHQWNSVLWSDESKFEIFGSTRRVYVRCREGEWMVSACVVPTVKHGRWGMVVWRCFAGDTVGNSIKIQGTLNQHGYHTILQQHAIPFGVCLMGTSSVFQQGSDPKHTSRLCKGYVTKKESDGVPCQMTWPPQSPNLNPVEMVWDELDHKLTEKQPTSAQHLYSFETVGKPFQVTTSFIRLRECHSICVLS